MSDSLVVCEVDPELKEKLRKFRFRKETDNAAIIMKVDRDRQMVVLEEEFQGCVQSQCREPWGVQRIRPSTDRGLGKATVRMVVAEKSAKSLQKPSIQGWPSPAPGVTWTQAWGCWDREESPSDRKC
ncbi:glia maturation factor gamma isoform X2 [Ochotona princeps]|uniref:glia maturation factor gamma isoform X2 n=1 Tax=Ochotona princeps TaxID=9978 RepID=UPI00271538FC|nr:glia maturation factor gamma isoform X2 [Ochotona princeps]